MVDIVFPYGPYIMNLKSLRLNIRVLPVLTGSEVMGTGSCLIINIHFPYGPYIMNMKSIRPLCSKMLSLTEHLTSLPVPILTIFNRLL